MAWSCGLQCGADTVGGTVNVGLGADSEEKREPVSDIYTAVVESLKVLDLKRPIREADIANRYIFAGLNLMAAIRVIRTKMASTAACVTAKGGSA